MCWLEVLAVPDLGRRLLALSGPRVGLRAREVCPALAEAWGPEVLKSVACSSVWEGLMPQAQSLHELLEPYSRRAAGSQVSTSLSSSNAKSMSTASKSSASPARLFDMVFVLLARKPQAAEEPQKLGRADEECSVVENMRRTPLIVAARCGLVSVAWLIAKELPGTVGPNQQDAMGCSALRYAIVNKDEQMCECLLRFPALYIEQRDARGDTSLFQAVGANAPNVCRILLGRTADASCTNRGQTALDLAQALGYEACTTVLKISGAPSASCDAKAESGSSESELDDEVLELERLPLAKKALFHAREQRTPIFDASADEGGECDKGEASQTSKRPQRWDVGGLFIKRRGGQSVRWHG